MFFLSIIIFTKGAKNCPNKIDVWKLQTKANTHKRDTIGTTTKVAEKKIKEKNKRDSKSVSFRARILKLSKWH